MQVLLLLTQHGLSLQSSAKLVSEAFSEHSRHPGRTHRKDMHHLPAHIADIRVLPGKHWSNLEKGLPPWRNSFLILYHSLSSSGLSLVTRSTSATFFVEPLMIISLPQNQHGQIGCCSPGLLADLRRSVMVADGGFCGLFLTTFAVHFWC